MISKLVFPFLLLLFFTIPEKLNAQAEKINWVSIEEAQSLQKISAKPVLIFVYATWNGWGKRMEKDTFTDATVIDYVNSNFYAVKLNGEGKEDVTYKGKTMSETMLTGRLRVRSYPTIVLLDTNLDNKVLKPGYKKTEGFIKMLKDYKGL